MARHLHLPVALDVARLLLEYDIARLTRLGVDGQGLSGLLLGLDLLAARPRDCVRRCRGSRIFIPHRL